MITRHHHLYTNTAPIDMAHIFEHLFILKAKQHLAKNGFCVDLFGWMRGETFDQVIFIDAGFYEPATAACFDEFIKTPLVYDERDISLAMETVAIEEKSEFCVSIIEIKSHLHALALLRWDTNEQPNHNKTAAPQAIFTKAARNFRTAAFEVILKNPTLSEQKVFFRLRPIIDDILDELCTKKFTVYPVGISDFSTDNTQNSFLSFKRFRSQSGSLAPLSKDLQVQLHSYISGDTWPAIGQHFAVFGTEPLWRTLATDLYWELGIITTTEEIATLATKERIETIFKKLTIKARTATSADLQRRR